MRHIPSEPLSEAWPKPSTDEKGRIAKQTAVYLPQLRTLQSDKIQSLGGRPAFSDFVFRDKGSETPHGPLASDDDIWDDMECGLKETNPRGCTNTASKLHAFRYALHLYARRPH
jgi:hypothetical protein